MAARESLNLSEVILAQGLQLQNPETLGWNIMQGTVLKVKHSEWGKIGSERSCTGLDGEDES